MDRNSAFKIRDLRKLEISTLNCNPGPIYPESSRKRLHLLCLFTYLPTSSLHLSKLLDILQEQFGNKPRREEERKEEGGKYLLRNTKFLHKISISFYIVGVSFLDHLFTFIHILLALGKLKSPWNIPRMIILAIVLLK
jgi:hypothetical protein